jgi:hypothetical protein
LSQATTPERHAETLFQIALIALRDGQSEAHGRLSEIVEKAEPSMIEYAAARHELARLGG